MIACCRTFENTKTFIDVSEHPDIYDDWGHRMSANLKQPTPARWTSLESWEEAAECLKTLAHPHRLRMIQMLLCGRYSVGELADACEIPSHMASEHLRLMQRCGFLVSEKEGRKAYYRIIERHLSKIMSCIEDRFGQSRLPVH